MTDKQAFANAILRKDFMAFVHRVFRTVVPGDAFQHGWHLDAIIWRLQQIERGETRRLIINVPPRSLKSIIVSVAWPAWLLGQDPTLSIACVSYSAELSLKHARDCRAVMTSDWYRRAFPKTVLSRERNAENDYMTTQRGGRFSTSVGGTFTGRVADLIIIDDPIKPEDAASDSARKLAIEWFMGTLVSRLNDKATGAIILVMQRLHEADLTGHLLEAGGWDHLCLPAIAEADEAIPIGPGELKRRRVGDLLHPGRESLEVLNSLKAAMGSAVFAAQFQQSPTPAGGLVVKRDWLQQFARPPEWQVGDQMVQSWDCASKEGALNDYSVCITALIRKRQIFILDIMRKQLTFPMLVKRCKALALQYGATAIVIEDAASGTQLIQHLRHEPSPGVPTPIIFRPKGDKITRLSGVSPRIEAGDLFLPTEAPWLADFERELLGFPNGRYDDQVDALSQLLSWSSRPLMDDSPIVGPIVFYRSGATSGEPSWRCDEDL